MDRRDSERHAGPADPGADTALVPSDLEPNGAPAPSRADHTIYLDEATPNGGDLDALVGVDPSHYELKEEVARGGMGLVRRARDRRVGREVALKELLVDAPKQRLRFEREARITGQLQHPSIVPVYELGHWPDQRPFYTMKLVAGRPLDAVVREARDADARLALVPRILPAVEAIAYAHEQGVIHRDLKPANVLLGDFGETVVIDWGLAKGIGEPDHQLPTEPDVTPPDNTAVRQSGADLTAAGAVLGTPAYMSPEQARGEPLDARADVYSLGALLYHALSGARPYGAQLPQTTLVAVLAGPPAPLSTLAPEAPADLVGIVNKAMARDPNDRYADARDLARDLEAFSRGRLVATYNYTSRELLARFVRRNPALSLTIVSLFVVVFVGAAATLQAYRRSERERERANRERVRAQTAEQRAVGEERTAHERLAQVHWRSAARRLQGDDHLGAELLAAAALLQNPSNPQSPYHRLGGEQPLSPQQRSQQLAGPAATWAAARALRFASRGYEFTGHRDWIFDVLPSADGRWVVSTSADHDVRIWDARTGQLHHTLEGHEDTVFQAAIRHDGQEIATSSYDGTVRLWSFPNGAPKRTLRHPAGRAYGVCYTSSGTLFSVGLGGKLAVWDPASGRLVSQLAVTRYLPWRLDCSAKSRLAVLGTAGPETVLIDVRAPRVVRRLSNDGTQVRGAVLTPDQKHVVTADKMGLLRRIDLTTGAVRAENNVGGAFVSLAISSDGRWLALGADGITMVDAATLRPVARLHGHKSTVVALAFDPTNRRIYSGSFDRSIIEWRVPEARDGLTLLGPRVSSGDSASVSPDGQMLVSAGDDTIVRLWDLSTGRLLHAFEGHTAPVRGLRFIDASRVASVGMDRTLRIHDITTRRTTRVLPLPHFGFELAYAPASGMIAVASGDGNVVVFEQGDWSSHVIPNVHEARTWWVGFDPTGYRLASASYSGSVALLDPTKRSVIRKWKGHEARIFAAGWRPDGKELTTADWNGWVRGWEPATGKRLREWREVAGERIFSLAWSPDARWLLLTTAGGMRLHQPDGVLVGRLDFVAGATAAAWTPDGKRMIFASGGRIFVLPLDTDSWRVDPVSLLDAAERAAGTTLRATLGIDGETSP